MGLITLLLYLYAQIISYLLKGYPTSDMPLFFYFSFIEWRSGCIAAESDGYDRAFILFLL